MTFKSVSKKRSIVECGSQSNGAVFCFDGKAISAALGGSTVIATYQIWPLESTNKNLGKPHGKELQPNG